MSVPGRLAMIASVIAALALLVWAMTLVDTDPDGDIAVSGDEDAVDRLIPGRDAEILSQEPVGVDLAPGWTGVLIVDGLEIPEDQLDIEPALGQYLFRPGPDKVIEEYPSDETCAAAVFWRVEASRADSRQVSWCFGVL